MHSISFPHFKRALRSTLLLCSAVATLCVNTACDDDDDDIVADKPSVTLITDYCETDDQGYHSLVYQTISQWEKRSDITVNILNPKSKEVAKEMYLKWPETFGKNGKSLLIVASPNYQEMVSEEHIQLNPQQQVLAFETQGQRLPEGVSSFAFNRNGASYLAGKMASKCGDIIVVAGKGYPYINAAWQAFQQGLEGQHVLNVEYLSYEEDGFNKPDSAYNIAKANPNAFIFPLAGKSNLGIYHYMKDCPSSQQIVAAGMDVNFNSKNIRIPFSIVLHIDKVLDQYLQDWISNRPWPTYQSWGMKSKMVEVVLNENFTSKLNVKKADYKTFFEKYKEEAIEKEEDFSPNNG